MITSVRALARLAIVLATPAAACAAGIDDASDALARRIEAARAAAERAAPPPAPRLEHLPVPASPRPRPDYLDLGRAAASPAEPDQPALLVFVSFSMPEASLRRLVDDAAASRATLVLRGFKDGSVAQTLGAAAQLLAGRAVAWNIDPDAFARYAIGAVPAYVLVRGGQQSRGCGNDAACAPGTEYVRVAGDVSIAHALRAMTDASPDFAAAAAAVRGSLGE